jgi:alpha-tubulin suppressor-like RCC1 family protein
MCGLTASGEAYCWGFNRWGQLGDGTTTDKSTPVAVAGGLQFTSLWAGGRRTCGVTTSGTAYCWGEDRYGALGDGTGINRTTPTPVLWQSPP